MGMIFKRKNAGKLKDDAQTVDRTEILSNRYFADYQNRIENGEPQDEAYYSSVTGFINASEKERVKYRASLYVCICAFVLSIVEMLIPSLFSNEVDLYLIETSLTVICLVAFLIYAIINRQLFNPLDYVVAGVLICSWLATLLQIAISALKLINTDDYGVINYVFIPCVMQFSSAGTEIIPIINLNFIASLILLITIAGSVIKNKNSIPEVTRERKGTSSRNCSTLKSPKICLERFYAVYKDRLKDGMPSNEAYLVSVIGVIDACEKNRANKNAYKFALLVCICAVTFSVVETIIPVLAPFGTYLYEFEMTTALIGMLGLLIFAIVKRREFKHFDYIILCAFIFSWSLSLFRVIFADIQFSWPDSYTTVGYAFPGLIKITTHYTRTLSDGTLYKMTRENNVFDPNFIVSVFTLIALSAIIIKKGKIGTNDFEK